MKFIFHTAQCGSSLLVSLLGTVNHDTYSEPSWSHNLIKNNIFPEFYPCIPEEKDFIIKLPSGLCCTAPATLLVPKVFLYRRFQDHVYRHLVKGNDWPDTEYFFEYESNHRHPSLEKFNPVTNIEKIAFFWLNDVLWMTETTNVKWVHADDLFLDLKNTLLDVCDFFKVSHIKSLNLANFDVKYAGLKGSDLPIAKIDILPESLYPRNIKNSVVLRPFRDACPRVAEILKWVENGLDEATIERLSPYIYD
jgi:hypothetical protein